jgi:tetratricopeptide (TPR) repeat protein
MPRHSLPALLLAAFLQQPATLLADQPAAPATESSVTESLDQLRTLAEQATTAKNLSAAIDYAKRGLAIQEKALGLEHPDVATSLINLADLYRVQGRTADAEPLFHRALAIAEKALGPAHPSVALSLNNLAAQFWAQGRYADAEPLYRRAYRIALTAGSPGSSRAASAPSTPGARRTGPSSTASRR